MRKLFIVLFLVNVAFTLFTFHLLPPKVAMNFGNTGSPNSWASKEVNTAIMLAIDISTFIVIFFLPACISAVPSRFINIRNKDYWLNPDNKNLFITRFGELLAQFGVVMFGFLLITTAITTHANISTPVRLNIPAFLTNCIAFMVYIVFWCMRMHRTFKVANGDSSIPVNACTARKDGVPAKHLFLKFILPERMFVAIKSGTRNWLIECPCGYKRDLWDAGGVRYKGFGEPRQLGKCARCGDVTWHKVRRKTDAEREEYPGTD